MPSILERALAKRELEGLTKTEEVKKEEAKLSIFQRALLNAGRVNVVPDGKLSTEDITVPLRGAPVGFSKDLSRVIQLPSRDLDVDRSDNAKKWTALLRKDVQKCECKKRYGYCITELNAVQGNALEEMNTNGGLFAPIGVGHGKTGIDVLASMVMGVKSAVLLLPANLRDQFMRDWLQWDVHFKVPNVDGEKFFVPGRPTLYVMSYSQLSQAKNTNFLKNLQPELIIADEAHNLKNLSSSRGARVKRLFAEMPCKFVALSGSMTTKSLKDYAHISAWSLKDNSPTPLAPQTTKEWAGAMDPGAFQTPAGALLRFCRPGESVREGYRRRLISTSGVVATKESAIGAALIMSERKGIKVPEDVQKMVQDINDTWQRPDGEELVEATQKAAVMRQMACGFYYKWRWPRGESKEVIETWLEVRSEWNKELREILKKRLPGLDSPLLCMNAAERGLEATRSELHAEVPVWKSFLWKRWKEVRGTAQPETHAVWVSDYLVLDAVKWAKSNKGIVWFEYATFGDKLREHLPVYGAGDNSVDLVSGEESIACSVKAQGTGRKLQMFNNNLIATPISDGATFEQLLGRTHRVGQAADEVYATHYIHDKPFRSALTTAVHRAQYIQDTLGTKQKLLYSSWEFDIRDFEEYGSE